MVQLSEAAGAAMNAYLHADSCARECDTFLIGVDALQKVWPHRDRLPSHPFHGMERFIVDLVADRSLFLHHYPPVAGWAMEVNADSMTPVTVWARSYTTAIDAVEGLSALLLGCVQLDRDGDIVWNWAPCPKRLSEAQRERVRKCINWETESMRPRLLDLDVPRLRREIDALGVLVTREQYRVERFVERTIGRYVEVGEDESGGSGSDGAVPTGGGSGSNEEAEASQTPKRKLSALGPHDRQAWQLYTLHGMTQQKVADALNNEHRTDYTQGHVSRMIARVMAHAEANGLAEKLPKRATRAQTIDPARLELGRRTDPRKPRPSDLSDD